MTKFFKMAFAFLFVVALGMGSSFAADAGSVDPGSIVTSAGALLTTIYPIVIGAVGFGILISLVKLVSRK